MNKHASESILGELWKAILCYKAQANIYMLEIKDKS